MEGVRARGDVAEVWQCGRQVGTLWDWKLEEVDLGWVAEAERQSFVGTFSGGDAGIRFFITAASEHVFQIRAEGRVTQFVAGEKMRHPCRMQGKRLWTIAAVLPTRSA